MVVGLVCGQGGHLRVGPCTHRSQLHHPAVDKAKGTQCLYVSARRCEGTLLSLAQYSLAQKREKVALQK